MLHLFLFPISTLNEHEAQHAIVVVGASLQRTHF